VIDLVCLSGLRILREENSVRCCSPLVEKIMRIGEEVSPEVFRTSGTTYLYDDHVPFIEAGIPAVLLSGPLYAEWHTTADLPAVCSAGSLEAVGRVLAELVYGDHEIP
jgi:hypothetical protein